MSEYYVTIGLYSPSQVQPGINLIWNFMISVTYSISNQFPKKYWWWHQHRMYKFIKLSSCGQSSSKRVILIG